MNKIPSALQLGIRRGGLEIRQFARQRESVVFTLLFPVILLAIFGSVFKETIAPGVTFSQYFVAGMIASGLVNTGFQALAITIPMERDFGALKRLRGTPMPASSYFIGKAIFDLCQYGDSDSFAIRFWSCLLWFEYANRCQQMAHFHLVSVTRKCMFDRTWNCIFNCSQEWARSISCGFTDCDYFAVLQRCLLCLHPASNLDAASSSDLSSEMAYPRNAISLPS